MGRRHIAGIYREKHFWLAVLAIAVCVVLYITPAEWTYAGGEDCASYEGTNLGGHNYYIINLDDAENENDYYTAYPTRSYLMECADGRYMVVQQGDMGVVVEYYNAKLERLSSQVLPAELPIFGGFYAMGGNYYLA